MRDQESEAFIRRRRAFAEESVRQALLFPRIHEAFQAYRARRDDPASLRDLQHQRLAALLTRVLETVPALRDTGVRHRPDDSAFDTLSRLPVLTKDDIRAAPMARCARDLDPADCSYAITSGTTGVPLKMIHNSEHTVHINALAWRRALEYGLHLDRKVLRPFKSEADEWLEYTTPSSGLVRFAEFGHVPAERADAIAQRCQAFRPDVVFTHPSRMLALRDLLAGRARIAPAVVLTFGEQLTEPVRAAIHASFDAPVYDSYGTNEVSTIAAQCPEHGSYHIESERVWVEILDDAGNPLPDGVEGEVVVTNLLNTAMPIVRYRTGDVGVLRDQRCPCGRPHKTMRLISGRWPGAIEFPDGSSTDVMRLIKLLDHCPVEQVQVIQQESLDLTVLVLPRPDCTDEDLRRAAEAATAALRGALPVTVRRAGIDEFVTTAAGKHRYFVSHRTG